MQLDYDLESPETNLCPYLAQLLLMLTTNRLQHLDAVDTNELLLSAGSLSVD